MFGKHRRLHRPGGAFLPRFISAALAVLLFTALPVWFSPDPVSGHGPDTRSVPERNAPDLPTEADSLRQEQKSPLRAKDAVVTPEDAADRPRCLLLIGQDTRDASRRARSDTMILCAFRKNVPQLTLISFLRDLYVRIPGHPDGRLNAAYALGGMPLLKQTFQENFGIEIDGCIEVDFDRFTQLVDLLDGVSLELRRDEANSIAAACGTPLEEGLQRLSGEQALAYVRIRDLDPDSDFSRTLRQRKLLHAILDRCRSSSALTLMKFTGKALPLLSTDLSKRQLITFSYELLPMLEQLQTESLKIPADGTFQEKTIDGMAVLAADEAATRAYLQRILFPE